MFKLDTDALTRLVILLRSDRDNRYALNKLRSWERCKGCGQLMGMYFPGKSFDTSTDGGPLYCKYYCKYTCVNRGYNESQATYFYLKIRSRRLTECLS